jgi:hypothetical protein
VLLRALVIVVWLAIAFMLPPMLGRSSVGTDGETGSPSGAVSALQPADIQPHIASVAE